MSRWNSRHSEANVKSVAIPDHVPVGAVIGKGGSYCKSLQQTHGVRCSVNGEDRKVTLKGSHTSIGQAEDELAQLFESFAISQTRDKRVFEVAASNGANRLWSFEEELTASSDANVEEFRYVLQPLGRAEKAESREDSWIKDFHEGEKANMMGYLLEKPSESPTKIKLAFGKLCFKLKAGACYDPELTWPELQYLRPFEDFSTRWTNVLDRTSPSTKALLDELEGKVAEDVVPLGILSVHLGSKLHKSWDLKYTFVDGQWELRRRHTGRNLRGSYDVLLDSDTSFRLRAFTRESLSGSDPEDVERYVEISTPPHGDIFDTTVTLKRTAPAGLAIRAINVKSKIHVDHHGLRFSVGYLDRRQSEFRLECRLSSNEKDKLGSGDNECRVLVDKVLQMVA
ncbi:hypothetical protein BBJ28_00015397 [Nothophytophthora sp. Chile5]|nr:hypothetical protein BBJ28_00015397 [Nothophytophthora sp. Chile5]